LTNKSKKERKLICIIKN